MNFNQYFYTTNSSNRLFKNEYILTSCNIYIYNKIKKITKITNQPEELKYFFCTTNYRKCNAKVKV